MQVSTIYKKKIPHVVHVKLEQGDLWEASTLLAKVIYQVVKKYRKLYDKHKEGIGYPAEFASDPMKDQGPDNPNRYEEWIQCLDKMVYSFGWLAKNDDWEGPEFKEYFKECDRLLKLHKKELKKLAKQDEERFKNIDESGCLNSLEWDRHSQIVQPAYEIFAPKFEEHRQKIQEGIDLFAKHFGSLWL